MTAPRVPSLRAIAAASLESPVPTVEAAEITGLNLEEGPGDDVLAPTGDKRSNSADGTEEAEGDRPDLWLYRDRTVALLRRYLVMAVEVGRLPSLLGREFFRTRVTSYHTSTFEDSVIFVHDMERSLEALDGFDKKLIAMVVLQQYTQEEAGYLLGCGHRTVSRYYPEALDRVSEILLARQILTRLPGTRPACGKSCQEGKKKNSS